MAQSLHALLLLLLELLLGEAVQLGLTATAVEHCLSGVFELHAELGILRLRGLARLKLGDILFLDGH